MIEQLKQALASRGIGFEYVADAAAARDYLLKRIPAGARVMTGGSTTLEQIGFVDALRAGPYEYLRKAMAGIDDQAERIRVRRQASTADWLIGGINAITMAGEIVNVDGSGTRIAGYAYGAGKVIMVAGVNKIVPDLAAAIDRIRNTAAVAECRDIGAQTPCAQTGRCDNDACRGRERQCGKMLIIENEKITGRITVLLIGQSLGY